MKAVAPVQVMPLSPVPALAPAQHWDCPLVAPVF
eukprot:COSAG05_NODE_17741_length_320_cov_0.678733_1_plen_33_part_10